MKKILFILVCFFTFPLMSLALTIKTESCPESVSEAFRKEFNNINVSYSFVGYNKVPYYNILVSNVHPKVTISTEDGKIISRKDNEVLIRTNKPGDIEIFYKAEYYNARYKNCFMYAKEFVKLPEYNPYYNREECNGLTAYKVCKKWGKNPGSEQAFKKEIENAKKDLEKKNDTVEKTKVKRVKRWYTYVSNIFVKYWWAVIIVIVLITGIFYSIRLKQKKNEYDFKL